MHDGHTVACSVWCMTPRFQDMHECRHECSISQPFGVVFLIGQPGVMDDGQKQLARQTAALKRLRQEIQTARRKQRELLAPRRKKKQSEWPLVLQTALAVWAANNSLVPAIEYLMHIPKNSRYHRQSMEEQLRAKVNSMDDNRRIELLQPTTKLGQLALLKARKFLREADLHSWVRVQNTQKGLAPSNNALWRRCCSGGNGQALANSVAEWTPITRKFIGRLQWLRRWKQRWNIKSGHFKPGDKLPLETLRAKVHKFPMPERSKSEVSRLKIGSQNEAQIPGSKLRPPSNFTSWAVPVFRAQNWAQF